MADILSAKDRLCDLVAEAYRYRTHLVLGYDTWEEFVEKELQMSRRRSYQLLDQRRASREFSVALGFEIVLGERVVRELRYDGIQEAIRKAHGSQPTSADEAQKIAERAVAEVTARPRVGRDKRRKSAASMSARRGPREDVELLDELATELLSIDPARIVSTAYADGARRAEIIISLRNMRARCDLLLRQLGARPTHTSPHKARVAESASA